MKQTYRKLYQHLSAQCHNSLALEAFITLLENSSIPWGLYKDIPYFPANHLALSLGKYYTDYQANWVNKNRHTRLSGYSLLLIKSEVDEYHKSVIKDFPLFSKPKGRLWVLDWSHAYDYITYKRSVKQHHKSTSQTNKKSNKKDISSQTLIDVSIHNDSFNSVPQSNISTSLINESGELLLDTRAVAQQLDIEHNSLLSLLSKYKDDIKSFGDITVKELNVVNSVKAVNTSFLYYLNEDQAYFLGTLSRNSGSAIRFKKWLVEQFKKARQTLFSLDNLTDTEAIIHRQLLQLANYTSLNLQSEFPLEVMEEHRGKLKKTIRRLDIIINNQIGLELKNEKITTNIIADIIGTRGYYHSLKLIPSFKFLALVSPQGITHSALKMLELTYPKVIFLSPFDIGEKIAQAALSSYPKPNHWWLTYTVFPKFSKILSSDFISSSQELVNHRRLSNSNSKSKSKSLPSS